MSAPEPTMSTARAAEVLGLCTKTVLALLRSGELKGYPQLTATSRRVHAWKVYESSVTAYQRRAEAASELVRARKGLVA